MASVGQLLLAAQTGGLPADGPTLGGEWPASVIDSDARDAMADWVSRSLTVMLHVALTEDGHIRGAVRVLDEDDDEPSPPTVH
jgi:hypothetical protein